MRLVLFIASLCLGQMLFKKAANSIGNASGVTLLTSLAFNGWFIVACLLYAFSTLVWITVLQRMPLTRAYPFVAAAFVVTPLASIMIFGERVEASYWRGALLILAGVYVTSLSL